MTSDHLAPLPDFKLGIQLYGLQDNFRKDMRGTLKALAGFGYQGIELIPPYETVAESLAVNLHALGLEAIGFYAFKPWELLDPNHATYGQLRTLDIRHVSIGLPQKVNQDWPEAIEEIRCLAEVVSRQGLTLDYHNHEQEFQCFQDHPALALLAEQSDPAHVQFELDTHFALKAGADPCRWIKRFAGRMTRLHLKDLNVSDGSVAVIGDGILDVHAVVAEAVRGGIEWIVIEFHPGLANPLEMARLCREGVRKIWAEMNAPKQEQQTGTIS